MLGHSLGMGVNFFFTALYCSCFGFNALLALPTREGGNKGIKFNKGARNCCYKIKISPSIFTIDINFFFMEGIISYKRGPLIHIENSSWANLIKGNQGGKYKVSHNKIYLH